MMRTLLLMALCVACSDASTAPAAELDAGEPTEADPLATLPDPLVLSDGRRVTTKEEWPARRAEILELFSKHVYGRSPGKPESTTFTLLEERADAIGGTATMRRVAIKSVQAGREHTFTLVLFAPNAAKSGVFLLLNNRPADHTDPTRTTVSEFWPAEAVLARGYAIAAIQNDELAPDDSATYASGVIRLFEGEGGARAPDAYKAIGAWSWGAMRAMDYLATDALVDPARVAVIGHSRGGKAALWAGAQDERFSLVVSNDSGCAGAALSRRPVGENVALINDVFPHWFADNFRAFANKEAELPIDQHELLALVAPRALAVGSGSEDNWADPEGEYLGLAYASPVYSLFGFAPMDLAGWPKPAASVFVAPRGYHLRVGGHELVKYDWERYLDVADRVWPR